MCAESLSRGLEASSRTSRATRRARPPAAKPADKSGAPVRVADGVTSRRRFERLVSRALLHGQPYMLAKLDVDHFRAFRSLHGVQAADALLRALGERLEQAVQPAGGLSARIGGDEFAVLVPAPADKDDIPSWARTLLSAASLPFMYRNKILAFTATLGFVHATEQPLTASDALRCAELAVARGKDIGGGAALPCSAAQWAQARACDELALTLKAAIANGQIVPFYQAVVSLRSGAIVGMEVLARWQHPVLGTLPPASFIAAAEDQGLCAVLTETLIGRVERDARDWPGHWHFAFNIPPRDVLTALQSIEDRDRPGADAIAPNRIELEVTETAIMRDLAEARGLIASFTPSGVKLVLDDFGTGYANFQQLRQIPFSSLKIDKSFITDMLDDPRGAACVQAIIDLAHLLGMTTTAEGVETEAVGERLTAMGCDHAQGYHYARPMPAVDVMRLIDTPPAGQGGISHAA